jgi:hypothetical protein
MGTEDGIRAEKKAPFYDCIHQAVSDNNAIFDADAFVVPATVKEQQAYFNEWVESLR